jgi:hypothetical protein
MNNPQGSAVLEAAVDETPGRAPHPSVAAVGDRFTWRLRPVELIDIANLQPDYVQVLVRFLDDANRPPVSMPYQDLIAGMTRLSHPSASNSLS